MKSSKTSFLRNCISGWNVRALITHSSSLVNSEEIVIFASRSSGSVDLFTL